MEKKLKASEECVDWMVKKFVAVEDDLGRFEKAQFNLYQLSSKNSTVIEEQTAQHARHEENAKRLEALERVCARELGHVFHPNHLCNCEQLFGAHLRTQCEDMVSVKEEVETSKKETKQWKRYVNMEFETRRAEGRAHSATVQGGRSGGPGGSGSDDDELCQSSAPVDEGGVKDEGA
jgi:hypothetical protein